MSNMKPEDLRRALADNPDLQLGDADARQDSPPRTMSNSVKRRLAIQLQGAQTESQMQAAVFAEAERRAADDPRYGLLFHIPSGEYRHKATAGRLKAMGVKPGLPDICLPVPAGRFASLWIELKVRGGRVRENQRAWHEALREQGHMVCVIWDDPIEVIDQIDWYLNQQKI